MNAHIFPFAHFMLKCDRKRTRSSDLPGPTTQADLDQPTLHNLPSALCDQTLVNQPENILNGPHC